MVDSKVGVLAYRQGMVKFKLQASLTAREEVVFTSWNTDQVSAKRWLQGQSACQQQVLAVAIFTSSTIT
jgi:hypothetical protein